MGLMSDAFWRGGSEGDNTRGSEHSSTSTMKTGRNSSGCGGGTQGLVPGIISKNRAGDCSEEDRFGGGGCVFG
jgi:hypothetical protein